MYYLDYADFHYFWLKLGNSQIVPLKLLPRGLTRVPYGTFKNMPLTHRMCREKNYNQDFHPAWAGCLTITAIFKCFSQLTSSPFLAGEIWQGRLVGCIRSNQPDVQCWQGMACFLSWNKIGLCTINWQRWLWVKVHLCIYTDACAAVKLGAPRGNHASPTFTVQYFWNSQKFFQCMYNSLID